MKYYTLFHEKKKKTQKHANINQRGSTGSIPSIEITKECLESGDYMSDESEYQEGVVDRSHRNNVTSSSNNANNGCPSPLPSHSQYQTAQHQYHQPQVRWMNECKQSLERKSNVQSKHFLSVVRTSSIFLLSLSLYICLIFHLEPLNWCCGNLSQDEIELSQLSLIGVS